MNNSKNILESFDFLDELGKSWSKSRMNEPGRIVRTSKGVIGRIVNSEPSVTKGKIAVYTKEDTILCSPDSLRTIGFIN